MTDGTAAGTTQLGVYDLAVAGGAVYIAEGYSYTSAYAGLYRTDRTAAGTVPLLGRDATAAAPATYAVTAGGGRAYFIATSAAAGLGSLTVSDGTAAGTAVVARFSPTGVSGLAGQPAALTAAGG